MKATRTRPEIGKVRSEDRRSCIAGPFEIVFWCFVTFIFVRIMSGTSTRLEQSLCVGTIIVFMVLLYRSDVEWKRAKEEWRAACKVDRLNIVDRGGTPGGTFEDGYGDIHSYHSCYHLELELNADQLAAAPNEKIVEVRVDETTYNRLLGRETVCIYYRSEAPLIFLLEDEL